MTRRGGKSLEQEECGGKAKEQEKSSFCPPMVGPEIAHDSPSRWGKNQDEKN